MSVSLPLKGSLVSTTKWYTLVKIRGSKSDSLTKTNNIVLSYLPPSPFTHL